MEHTDARIKLAKTEEEALKQIRYFQTQGYANDEIYVLAHDNEQTEGLVKLTQASEIGINQEGVMTALANLFRSQGDKLRPNWSRSVCPRRKRKDMNANWTREES